ncbi:hypothetical protein GTA08_BOTSDO01372 [Neofusicoccum parvum]|uniref:Uncharacterized protein n=2 Tax=Neofusicoccum parvum TaxID=310453 RepID=R1G5S6_BOTPV|nr:hypothetical protein UCRNP2_6438 [Neofusicoccum parvum UCRNP2]GME41902.1 hypothetical protein GTA08_BOTSDO01372 [Neofusicoccum parvum]GME60497.1 hypothetical protein GTA08_BOTSDO01372 [Neofusicoccum parvum]
MNRVGQVHDYDQWANDANRGQNARLATAAAMAAGAASQPQESTAQVDQDQHHTYQYIPQYDYNRHPNRVYGYIAPARHRAQPVYWPGMYHPGWYRGYPLNNPYSHHHNCTTPRHGQEMVPRNPGDGDQFWVRELDGNYTLRHYNTIENDLRPGHWTLTRDGRAQFIRTRE